MSERGWRGRRRRRGGGAEAERGVRRRKGAAERRGAKARRKGGGAEAGVQRRRRWGTHLEHAELTRARNLRDAEIALAHRHERAPFLGVAQHLDRLECERVGTRHVLREALELGDQTPRRRLLT